VIVALEGAATFSGSRSFLFFSYSCFCSLLLPLLATVSATVPIAVPVPVLMALSAFISNSFCSFSLVLLPVVCCFAFQYWTVSLKLLASLVCACVGGGVGECGVDADGVAAGVDADAACGGDVAEAGFAGFASVGGPGVGVGVAAESIDAVVVASAVDAAVDAATGGVAVAVAVIVRAAAVVTAVAGTGGIAVAVEGAGCCVVFVAAAIAVVEGVVALSLSSPSQSFRTVSSSLSPSSSLLLPTLFQMVEASLSSDEATSISVFAVMSHVMSHDDAIDVSAVEV
jgi:hypothetical protein